MRLLRDLTQDEKAEFERIKHSRLIYDYIQTSLDTAKTQLMGLPNNEDFRFVQGQAQVLQHLLNAMEPGKR